MSTADRIAEITQRIGDIQGQGIRDQGNLQAQAIANSGQIWSQAISNLGQLPGQVFGQMQQYKAQQQEQQIRQLQIQRAQQIDAGEKGAQALLSTLPRGEDGTYDVSAAVPLFAQHGLTAEQMHSMVGTLDALNTATNATRAVRLNHAADLANAALETAKRTGEPLTVPGAVMWLAGAQDAGVAYPSDVQKIKDALLKGADPTALFTAMRNQGEKYKPKAITNRTELEIAVAGGDLSKAASNMRPGGGDGKTREVKVTNPDGTETISIVEDKAGQTFTSTVPQASMQSENVLLDGKPAKVNFNPKTGKYADTSGQDVSTRVKPMPPASVVYPQAAPAAGAPGELTPDGLEYAATQYRVTGQMPSLGMGKTPARAQIINKAAEQAKTLGQSPAAAIQRQAAFKADSNALKQMQTLSAGAEAAENKAIGQIAIIKDLSAKVPRTQYPIINSALQAGKVNIIGDSNAQQLANAIQTFSNEYGKIIEGSTASVAGSSDAARSASTKLVNAAMNGKTMTDVLNLMQREMDLTLGGYGATIDHITTRMGGAPAPQSAAPTAPNMPPPGARVRTWNPKTGRLE